MIWDQCKNRYFFFFKDESTGLKCESTVIGFTCRVCVFESIMLAEMVHMVLKITSSTYFTDTLFGSQSCRFIFFCAGSCMMNRHGALMAGVMSC